MNRKLTTNSRLVNELFANYISTFTAFCELINNSIQAKANNVWIDIDYTDNSEIHPTIISQITIKDDGIGVHRNELIGGLTTLEAIFKIFFNTVVLLTSSNLLIPLIPTPSFISC